MLFVRWQGKTVCFHLKGGLARIFPVARGTLLRPGQFFTRGRAPTQRADVADHFIKLLYYSSGPCGDPSPLPSSPVFPFSRPFFTATYVDEGLALSRVHGPSTALFPPSPSLFLFAVAAKKFAGSPVETGLVEGMREC